MHSQDLYYSYKLAKEAILKNRNIKQCIFCMSCFILHQDLSKGESLYSQNMIKNVYYPLLDDIHNSNLKYIQKQKTLKECELDIYMNIFDIDKVDEYIKSIFNSNITSYYNSIYNLNRQISLNDFDMQYKEKLGLDRANGHKKMFKHHKTEVEYRDILKEFFNFLDKNDVQPIIVVFPASTYYLKNIKAVYIQKFNDLLKHIEGEYNIKVIDLRDSFFEFYDGDFIDVDHLNEKGAIKATNYLKQFV